MNFLIYGYGRMGKRYGEALKKLSIPWDYFDLNIEKNVHDFTHVIIATPSHIHADCYRSLRDDQQVLIEKPVVTEMKDLELLNQKNVYPALIERYNPIVSSLLGKKPVMLDFRRVNSNPIQPGNNTILDLSIHDLDLYFWITNSSEAPPWTLDFNQNLVSLSFHGDIPARFLWGKERQTQERRISLYTENEDYHVDLQNHAIHPSDMLCALIEDFIGGNRIDAILPHKILLEANNKLNEIADQSRL